MYKKKKYFITKTERKYYNILNEIINEYNLEIVPQVNLATIIDKPKAKYANELYRNVDFGIFSKNYKELLLLIEINDRTHKKEYRKERDIKVNNYTKEAGINLITLYTYSCYFTSNMNEYKTYYIKNNKEDLKKRLIKELEIQK